MTELYKLKCGSPLRVDGLDFTFHHIDGMYSLCTLDDDPREICHLQAWTPMQLVDGRWEIASDPL